MTKMIKLNDKQLHEVKEALNEYKRFHLEGMRDKRLPQGRHVSEETRQMYDSKIAIVNQVLEMLK
jgi:hypothetical protein